MKLYAVFTLSLVTWLSTVLCDSEIFAFLGGVGDSNSLEYVNIYEEGNDLLLGHSPKGLSAVVTNDGKLKLSNELFIKVENNGCLVMAPESEATSGFKIEAGHLCFQNKQDFWAVSDGGGTKWYSTPIDNYPKLNIRALAVTGTSVVKDFDPSDPNALKTTSGDSGGTIGPSPNQSFQGGQPTQSTEDYTIVYTTKSTTETEYVFVTYDSTIGFDYRNSPVTVEATTTSPVSKISTYVIPIKVPLTEISTTSSHGNQVDKSDLSSVNNAGRISYFPSYFFVALLLFL